MKKLPLILSIVSVVAVAVLFVLDFSEKEENESGSTVTGSEQSDNHGIAYVEVDTLVYNFTYYKDLSADLMTKQQKKESELNAKGKAYQTGVNDYQNKVNKGLVTRATAAQMEQALMQQQQDLVNLRDQMQYDLAEEEQVMNRKVLEYIYTFLEEYNMGHNYQYILGKSFGGQVMYSDTAFDITDDVLLKLNEKYSAEKK